MHPGRQVVRKNRIDHAMPVDPGLSFEGRRHNINSEVRLPARACAGMTFVLVGFINDVEAFGRVVAGRNVFDAHGCSLLVDGTLSRRAR